MVAIVSTVAFLGLEARAVEVQVQLSTNVPAFIIVGLPDKAVVAAMRLSARGFHRVLRVSRTIADLAGAEQVGRIHVAEALSYRRQPPRD